MLFEFKWLRRLVRRNTKQIPIETALKWKKRLSFFYFFVTWQAMGLVIYQLYTGRQQFKETGIRSKAEKWADNLNLGGNITYYKAEGTKITDEYTFHREVQPYGIRKAILMKKAEERRKKEAEEAAAAAAQAAPTQQLIADKEIQSA